MNHKRTRSIPVFPTTTNDSSNDSDEDFTAKIHPQVENFCKDLNSTSFYGITNPAYTSTPKSSNFNIEDTNSNLENFRRRFDFFQTRSISTSAINTLSTENQPRQLYDKIVKDSKTQTEETFNVITSWKLVETVDPESVHKNKEIQNNHSNSKYLKLFKNKPKNVDIERDGLFNIQLPPGKEYVVINSKSLGIDNLAQTRNAHFYRYSEDEAYKIILLYKIVTILLPCVWTFIIYLLDQLLDIFFIVDMCSNKRDWGCGLGITFIALPSLFLSVYSYEELIIPSKPNIIPMNKYITRVLMVLQLTPYILICRRIYWCCLAIKRSKEEYLDEEKLHNKSHHSSFTSQIHTKEKSEVLWITAAEDKEVDAILWYESVLESVPQFSLQTSILMVSIKDNIKYSPVIWASVITSLLSTSLSLTTVFSEKRSDKIAGSIAIFITLGSRVFICSGASTLSSAMFLLPFTAATLIGLAAKLSECEETSMKNYMKNLHKYIFEGLIMSTICPPFNTIGVFSSITYFLSSFSIFMESPEKPLNIAMLFCSILGQSAWLLIGFFFKS